MANTINLHYPTYHHERINTLNPELTDLLDRALAKVRQHPDTVWDVSVIRTDLTAKVPNILSQQTLYVFYCSFSEGPSSELYVWVQNEDLSIIHVVEEYDTRIRNIYEETYTWDKGPVSDPIVSHLSNITDAYEEDIDEERGILYKNGDSIYLQYPGQPAAKITVTILEYNLKETDNDPRSWDDQEPAED
jgi:hypothetical protein